MSPTFITAKDILDELVPFSINTWRRSYEILRTLSIDGKFFCLLSDTNNGELFLCQGVDTNSSLRWRLDMPCLYSQMWIRITLISRKDWEIIKKEIGLHKRKKVVYGEFRLVRV